MRLLPMLLIMIAGWVLFRMIRVFLRMGRSTRRETRDAVDPETSGGPSSSLPRRTILDAEFEDLTPPRKPADEEPEKPRA